MSFLQNRVASLRVEEAYLYEEARFAPAFVAEAAHDVGSIRRLRRLLSSSMMQNNDSAWTRQRQREFIKSWIEALGGTP